MNILDTFRLTPTQRTAATEENELAVSAGAGSGKTNTLTARFVHLVDQNHAPRRVVAITFTEKATREMRNRIRSHIQRWIQDECPPEELARWRAIAAELDAAHIGTIHALCAEILRAHPAEAGIDPRFGVLDEGDAAALKAEVVTDSLAWATTQSELVSLFETFSAGALTSILSELLARRLEAETAFSLAASGDEPLAHELRAFLDVPAVREAWDTLRGLVSDGTLEADAGEKLAPQVKALLAQLAQLERELDERRAGDAALCLFRIRREQLGLNAGSNKSKAKQAVRVLQTEYDDKLDPWLNGKNSADKPPDPALDARAGAILAQLRVLFQHAESEYQRAKDRRAELDFDDMERGAQNLLRRPEICARWQAQIEALLVDEFQDTNERQREIIEALSGSGNGRLGHLFIVGDPKQSIYRFRGADVTVFARVREDILRRGGKTHDLTETFRAHTDLIETLNILLARVMDSTTPRGAYYTPFAGLKSSRTTAPKCKAPYVELLYGMGDDARRTAAELLAARLHELHDTEEVTWDKVVCLFRASTGFDEYEQAFADANIPFVTVAGRGFYDRPEIRDLLNILRAVTDPSDDLAMAGFLRSPAFGLSDAALYQLRWAGETPRAYFDALQGDLTELSETDRGRAQEARRILISYAELVGRVSVAELLKGLLVETLYPALLATAGQRLQRNVEKLLADAYASGRTNGTEFLEYIETLRDVGAREGEAPSEAEGAVRLMTVHKAKGLQFPIVVLADAARGSPAFRGHVLMSEQLGVVPRMESEVGNSALFALAKGFEQDRARAEDLRVLYVAATRAQEKLIVCAHESKHVDRRVWFHELARAANLSTAELEAEPNVPHERALTDTLPAIRWRAGSTPRVAPSVKFEETRVPEKISVRLSDPLPSPGILYDDSKELTLEEQLAENEASQIGKLFHAGMREWCFPGSANFEPLMRAAAANFSPPAPDVVPRVGALLERVRYDARWQEMNDAAVRRHEVPFTFAGDQFVKDGTMDLLYQTRAGAWQIVDFKTEEVERAALKAHVAKYRGQVARYLEAARRIGLEAQGWLCFVACEAGVAWELVEK